LAIIFWIFNCPTNCLIIVKDIDIAFISGYIYCGLFRILKESLLDGSLWRKLPCPMAAY
jgi:hypothetical protein